MTGCFILPLLGGLGAFVGFALGGPVGLVLGCLLMLGFLWLANS